MAYDDEKSETVPTIPGDDSTARFVNSLFKKGLKHSREQHEAIKWARQFTAGKQWDPEDEVKLRSENRPTSSFNFVRRNVNVVSGVEILNRLQPTFMARVMDNDLAQRLGELDTGVHEYVMESCDGHFEKSIAFRHAVNEGLGFLKFRLDMVDNTDQGDKIVWENCDATHVVWDKDAQGKQNLKDSRYFIYFAKVPVYEAAAEWPDEAEYIKSSAPSDYDDTFGITAKNEIVVPPPYDPINKYQTDEIDNSGRSHVIVKEAYWYIDEQWMSYIDPFDPKGGLKEMPKNDWAKFKKDFLVQYPDKELQAAARTKRVYKRAFVIGGRTMEESDAPLQTGMPILAITGDYDDNDKVYRGLAYLLKDPQQTLNRYLSQTMHAIATTPRGVLLFEDGAFKNYLMAEEQWAQWAPFIPMEEGALSGEKPKFVYLPPQQIGTSTFQMMDVAMKVLEQIAGINIEMLGSGEGDVPGITMRQRQAVAMIAMADYFAAYRRFLKAEAVRTLEAVREFYTDERIIRIGGQYDSIAIQLMREDFSYPLDVQIDEAPYTPDNRDKTFAGWAPLMPTLFKSGAIMQVPSLVDYFPGAPKPRAELKSYIVRMGQQIAQAGGTPGQKQGGQGQQKGKQEDPRVTQGRVALMDTKRQETMAKARKFDTDSSMNVLKTLTDVISKREQGQLERLAAGGDSAERTHRVRRDNQKARTDQLTSLLAAMSKFHSNGTSAEA